MSLFCPVFQNRPHISSHIVHTFYLPTLTFSFAVKYPCLTDKQFRFRRTVFVCTEKLWQYFSYPITERNLVMKYFDSALPLSSYKFSDELFALIQKHCPPGYTLVFLCIGSDRATGDCLGPILGYKLSRFHFPNSIIYGTLDRPVHAKNLGDIITEIHSKILRPFIIAIDASLGKMSHIGFYTLSVGPLKPGAGVNKTLPAVGDITITGIVNISGFLDQMLLQTTRLNVVMRLADRISDGICHCLQKMRSSQDCISFVTSGLEDSASLNDSCNCFNASPIVFAAPDSKRISN